MNCFPIWIIVAFQQRDTQDSQNLSNDTFLRPPVTTAQCVILTEKYLDSAILLNYNGDDFSQGYGQSIEDSRALTKDNIFKPYLTEHDSRSTNDGGNIGYKLYVFDIRYQKKLQSAQPNEVEFKFSENVPAGIYCYVLLFTNKLGSLSSVGQRHFDLV